MDGCMDAWADGWSRWLVRCFVVFGGWMVLWQANHTAAGLVTKDDLRWGRVKALPRLPSDLTDPPPTAEILHPSTAHFILGIRVCCCALGLPFVALAIRHRTSDS